MYRDRPIFYSLGNFVFDQTFVSDTRDSFIAKITVGDAAGPINVEVVPIRIDKRNYSPELLESPDREGMLNRVDKTRSSIEGVAVPTYEERAGDYDLLYRRYKSPALRSMKKQFILNIPRYSSSTFFTIIRSYIGRRVGEQK
jgi:hypothetical protein